MVIQRYVGDRYRYSVTLHSYKPNHEVGQAKAEKMKPEWTLKIKEEVEKQYNVEFLKVVNYQK